ncbi:hypothetical protein BH10ACT1_BH10ACT1_03320 [soil metagenome]
MNLAHYLGLLHRTESNLSDAFCQVADAHEDEPDVARDCRRMARQCHVHVDELRPFVDRYGEDADDEPDRLHSDLFHGTREGGLALLRDLHDLYLMASEADLTWTLIGQAAQGARDHELLEVVHHCETDTTTQLAWLKTRSKQAAPQALVVA